jgi:hypothetical protein
VGKLALSHSPKHGACGAQGGHSSQLKPDSRIVLGFKTNEPTYRQIGSHNYFCTQKDLETQGYQHRSAGNCISALRPFTLLGRFKHKRLGNILCRLYPLLQVLGTYSGKYLTIELAFAPLAHLDQNEDDMVRVAL